MVISEKVSFEENVVVVTSEEDNVVVVVIPEEGMVVVVASEEGTVMVVVTSVEDIMVVVVTSEEDNVVVVASKGHVKFGVGKQLKVAATPVSMLSTSDISSPVPALHLCSAIIDATAPLPGSK